MSATGVGAGAHHVKVEMDCSTTSVVGDVIAFMFHLSQYFFSLHSQIFVSYLSHIVYCARL